MRVLIATLIAVAVSLGGVAAYATTHRGAGSTVETTSPAAATGPARLQLGHAAHVESGPGARATITPTGPTYPPGDRVVVFTIAVACSSGRYGFASTDLYVVADGSRVRAGTGPAAREMGGVPVVYGTVPAGERRRGPIAFATTALHGTLVYEPGHAGAPAAAWSF